jgi:hypothetical protein
MMVWRRTCCGRSRNHSTLTVGGTKSPLLLLLLPLLRKADPSLVREHSAGSVVERQAVTAAYDFYSNLIVMYFLLKMDGNGAMSCFKLKIYHWKLDDCSDAPHPSKESKACQSKAEKINTVGGGIDKVGTCD